MRRKHNFIVLIILTALSVSCRKEDRNMIPRIRTSPVVSITDSSAVSGGTVINEGGSSITEKGVCWSTDEVPRITDNKTLNGTGSGDFTSTITGLTPGNDYYVRAFATNATGTGYGIPVPFRTPGESPVAETLDASDILPYSAILKASVNAGDLSTLVSFEYGLNKSYGQSVTAMESPVTGNTGTPVSAGITGLQPGKTYHFRVKAVNKLGSVNGNDMTFLTPGQKPTATTLGASYVSGNSVTLNAVVNANHLATIVTFEYGINKSYGQNVPAAESPVTGNSDTNVSAIITGLTGGTTYHFRVTATNDLGTVNGEDETFTTP